MLLRESAVYAMAKKTAAQKKPKVVKPTGIPLVDDLAGLSDKSCTIDAYVAAASEYIKRSGDLGLSPKKAAQIRLSNALGRALVKERLSTMHAIAGERRVSGALRTVNADVSELNELDGLRLAVEIKPINLAVGRAIWNRFGDIRTFAVNLHLKFPFCVVGGVLAIPTYEAVGSAQEIAAELIGAALDPLEETEIEGVEPSSTISSKSHRSTTHLIDRAIARLVRAGGRKTEGDAAHLLEGIAVVVYNPDEGVLHPTLPAVGSGLRWEEFIENLLSAYLSRFEV
jgi:hypothetical protein